MSKRFNSPVDEALLAMTFGRAHVDSVLEAHGSVKAAMNAVVDHYFNSTVGPTEPPEPIEGLNPTYLGVLHSIYGLYHSANKEEQTLQLDRLAAYSMMGVRLARSFYIAVSIGAVKLNLEHEGTA